MQPAANERRGKSFYLVVAGGIARFVDETASPFAWMRWAHRRWSNVNESPLWLAEAYQLVWMAMLFVLLLTAPHIRTFKWVAVGLVVFRSIDILANLFNGILLISAIESARRTVLTVMGNALEIVLGASILLTNAGCVTGRFRPFYSAARTLVTIGPISGADDKPVCQVITIGEVAANFVLILVVFAAVVGSVKMREKQTAAQQGVGADGAAEGKSH